MKPWHQAGLLGALFCAACAPANRLEAQNLGSVALQTTQQSFSISMGATSANTAVTATAVGQVGHWLDYKFAGSTNNGCAFLFDGSQDNVTFRTLAVGTDFFSNGSTFTNGYYPFLRLKVNPINVAACSGVTLTIQYTGFQVPVPINPPVASLPGGGVASPTAFLANIKTPQLVVGFQCFNPNAATAFLESFDSATTPTLGVGIGYQVGIAAGTTFNYPGPPLLMQNKFWLGAATAAGGGTAVATALTCSAQININGPFYPVNLVSP